MSLFLLLAIIAGVLFGRVIAGWPPLPRRAVPGVLLVLGLILMRQGNREIGLEAVRNGEMASTGIAGLMLVLLGLMALLTLVVIFIGGELSKAQKHSGRRK